MARPTWGRRELPVITSAETSECGLAALAMVARFHGHRLELNDLRQRFAVSLSGLSLRTLITFADQLQLAPRALRVELDALRRLRLPAILHWNLDHYVVLARVGRRTITIHDPAAGRRTLTWAQASRHVTGVALELEPAADFAPLAGRGRIGLGLLVSRLRGVWAMAGQILVLSLILQIAVFAAPFYVQLAVDQAILQGDRDLMTALALGFAAVVLVQVAAEWLRGWAIEAFGRLLVLQMVGNVFRHLLRLPVDFFEKRHVGDLMSRMGSTEYIKDMVTRGVIAALIDGLMAAGMAVVLFVYAPLLAWVVVAAVALNAGLAAALYPAMRARTEELIVTGAAEHSHRMESMRAATLIKLSGREAMRENAWRNIFAHFTNTSFSLGTFQVSLAASQNLVNGLQTILIVYLGARLAIAGQGFSVGMLVAFLAFRQTFTDRTLGFINQLLELRLVGLHVERLGDIIGTRAERADRPLPALREVGRIALRDVSFRYGDGEPLVLDGVHMTIERGDFVAITGPSGGGKTTLLKLMLGLYEPSAGRIELDGLEPSPEHWRAWRGRIGVVTQGDQLLAGSIADNIAFFDPDLDMERVHEAARVAQVHETIMARPMQYMSRVGDMGSALSGGQVQRILLARALYRRPDILFLDEGTANLDEATEQVIAKAISSMRITRIVVAHRPALIHRANVVLRVDGRAVTIADPHRRSPAPLAVAT